MEVHIMKDIGKIGAQQRIYVLKQRRIFEKD